MDQPPIPKYADTSLSDQFKHMVGVTLAFAGISAAAYVFYTPPVPKVHTTTRAVPIIEYHPLAGASMAETIGDSATSDIAIKHGKIVMRGHTMDREYAYDLEHVIDTLNATKDWGLPMDLRAKSGAPMLVPDPDGDCRMNGTRYERKGTLRFTGAYDETTKQIVDQHWTIEK